MFKSWMWKQRSYRDQFNDGTEGGAGGSGTGGEGKNDDAGTGAGEGEGDGKGDDGAGGEGKPKPTDAEAKLLKEVMDKKTALRNTQTELADVKARLAAFDGLDATELKTLMDEKKALETRKLEEKGEWDRLKAQMADENKKAIETVNTALAAEKSRGDALARQVAELTVGGAFTTSPFIKEELTLPASKARALYGAHFEFNAEKGTVVAFDKAAGAAERTTLVDAQGEPLSFEAALKKLIDADPDRDQMMKSKVKVGTGSKTTEKGKPPTQQFEQPKGIDRIAAALRAKSQQ